MTRQDQIHYKTAPNFPEYKSGGLSGFLIFLWGVLLWSLLLILFLGTLYINLVTQSLITILRTIKPKPYHVPFWFSLILTIFIFPLSLVLILGSTLIKIIKD